MNNAMNLQNEAMNMLIATSRTFSIPIRHLPPGLKEAVTSAYLSMRAIDEIEDHPQLPAEVKINLLQSISHILKNPVNEDDLMATFRPHQSLLPEVTLRLNHWMKLCPAKATPSISNATSEMAAGMAHWVGKRWQIRSENDLDQYIYYVAGLVGIMLSDLWEWYDDLQTDRDLAVAFGRGLQAVNMIRNRSEDLARGVDFYPSGWESAEMIAYARRNLSLAELYLRDLSIRSIFIFCKIPLALAHGTLDTLEAGEAKLSRAKVAQLVGQIIREDS